MLTIKTRHPWRKTFVYGGSGFIVGFAGVFAFLLAGDMNQSRFTSHAPQQEVAQKVQTGENTPTNTSKNDQSTSNGADTSQAATPSWSSAPSKSASAVLPPTPVPQQSTPSTQTTPPQQTTTPIQTNPVVLEVPLPSGPEVVPGSASDNPIVVDPVITVTTP